MSSDQIKPCRGDQLLEHAAIGRQHGLPGVQIVSRAPCQPHCPDGLIISAAPGPCNARDCNTNIGVTALQRSHADIGIAVSGIAGPGGGTDDKPVGTVWLAWGSADDLHTWQTVLPTDRRMFQQLVAAAGLDLVRRHLLGLPRLPHYFSRRAI